jgi:tetratricopeptide (TPR) repeat protein/tRNA A-37 threonylcarbamoyl transferase component Bud32
MSLLGAAGNGLMEPKETEFMVDKPAPAADAMEGRMIGHYRIVRRIGQGGMGAVFLALRADDEFRKRVALKLVRPGFDSGMVLERFRTERQTLAVLDHPNIVRLVDGGTTEDGLPYLVMDYVEGQTIDRYVHDRNLTVLERLKLFRDVCSAVHYAHQNLIVHRDLKPSNILVTADGTPKLLDFGIAKILRAEYAAGGAGLTQTSAQPLTLEYASPEQVLGQHITTASDVYSLGVLLFELLTGQLPYRFQTHTPLEVSKVICEQQPTAPSTVVRAAGLKGRDTDIGRQLKSDLDMIVLTALRKEPQRRYASAEQLSEDIRRYMDGRPVVACGDSVGYRMRKFVTRHKAGVAGAVAVLLILIASTIVSAWYAGIAERRSRDLRQLAGLLLTDFDEAMRSGSIAARSRVAMQALDSLDRVAADAGGDIELKSKLIEGYLRVGDILGNLYNAHLGDTTGAKRSYERARNLAQQIGGELERARAEARLAEITAQSGDHAGALALYRAARETFEKAGAKRDLMTVLERTGFTQYQSDDLAGALASYRRYLEVAREVYAADPHGAEARRAAASGRLKIGEIVARQGDVASGLSDIQIARTMLEDILSTDPANIPVRRQLSAANTVLGDILQGTGRTEEAAAAFGRGLRLLEVLARGDPQNWQFRRDLALTSSFLAELHAKAGRHADARLLTAQALSALRDLADRPDATWYDRKAYAWLLVTTRYAELKNPAEAVRQARLAADQSKGRDPSALHTLARAYFESGDIVKAVETEERAIAALPASEAAHSHARKELEAALAQFRSALAAPKPPGSK